MAKLTTHILDTAHGKPAAGVAVRLFSIGSERILLKSDTTNADGRLDTPLLEGSSMAKGTFEIEFDIGEYFRKLKVPMDDPAFVDEVVLRFGIAHTNQHYHVPLLATPWSYSTYRGS